jgi:hypothetical protein
VSDARSDALKGAPSGALIVTGGGRGIAIRADVSVEADIVRAFEQVDRELDGVRALVNNAASNGGRTRLEDVTLEHLERSFRTNAFGSFLCAREATRRMSTRRGGRGCVIVNISRGRRGSAARACGCITRRPRRRSRRCRSACRRSSPRPASA